MRLLYIPPFKLTTPEVCIVILATLAPLKPIVSTVIFLILIDMVTGIFKAKKNNQPIKSKTMGHTISKIIFYNLTILSAFFIEKNIEISQYLYLTQIVSGVVCMVEFKSISENVGEILGFDLFKQIMDAIKRKSSEDKKDKDKKDSNS